MISPFDWAALTSLRRYSFSNSNLTAQVLDLDQGLAVRDGDGGMVRKRPQPGEIVIRRRLPCKDRKNAEQFVLMEQWLPDQTANSFATHPLRVGNPVRMWIDCFFFDRGSRFGDMPDFAKTEWNMSRIARDARPVRPVESSVPHWRQAAGNRIERRTDPADGRHGNCLWESPATLAPGLRHIVSARPVTKSL